MLNSSVDDILCTRHFNADMPNETEYRPKTFENYCCLRLTESGALTEEAFSIIKTKYVDQSCTYMFCRETGKNKDNPHFHAAFKVVGKMQAFRQWIKRKLCAPGNSTYSLKTAIAEKMPGYFNYLCKGEGTGKKDGPEIVFASNDFNDAIIAEFNKRYWQVNAQLREGKTKRKREEPAAKQILAICRQKLEHGHKELSNACLLEDAIIDITIEWYYRNKHSMNVFQMKSVVNYVAYGLNSNSNRVALMKAQMKFQ